MEASECLQNRGSSNIQLNNNKRPKSKILVVDYYDLPRQSITNVLEEEGYKVVNANNCLESLEIYKESKFDLVITDIKMPKMDGVTFIRSLKTIAPQTPVIVLTAYASIELTREVIKMGVHDYLLKPFDKKELLSTIKDAFKQTIRIKPDDALAHFNLGSSYMKLCKWKEAVDAFNQAIRIESDDAEAFFGLGVSYGGLGKYQDAIDAYKQVIRIKPDDAEAHYVLGNTYGMLGKYQKTVDTYKQAIRIKPDFADAHYNLGRAYLLLNDKGSALDEYKILKNLDKELANELFDLVYPK